VFEHTLGMVRNLCHGTPCGARAVVEAVEEAVGEEQGVVVLLRVLGGCMTDVVPNGCLLEALGVLSNMAANCQACSM
jgi:hypothetical protein